MARITTIAVVHLVNADLPGDREQQRPEQHDRRDALEHASEHDEGDDRDARKPGSAGQRRHRRGERRREARLVSAQAMPVAAPMMSRIAPDRAAVSTSIGQAGASRTAGRSAGRPAME